MSVYAVLWEQVGYLIGGNYLYVAGCRLSEKHLSELSDGVYTAMSVGRYNPDWAIAFYEGTVKHIYFVAETKGSMRSMQMRLIEQSKIHCAKEHFKAISGENMVYDVVDSYKSLLEKVMR